MSVPENLEKFEALVDIIARLRAPDGCPWDREQTHASLRENLLGECYEVLAALDKGDTADLCEELGDLLMQVVLHAQIARENGDFEIGDVIKGISEKLISRHPHVFGSKEIKDADEVLVNWEILKKKERGPDDSMLAKVPLQLPALEYSRDIQGRVARVGFDWDNDDGVIDKLLEEVGEFKQAESQEMKEWEFGDLLFTLVNLGRRQGIDAESALRQANRRFFQRFSHIEVFCRERGLELGKLSFDELNALWEEAKKEAEK